MTKYGPKAQSKIKKVMHEYGEGKLKSGKSEKPVKSQKQAVAIAISEARKSGGKVPKKTTASKSSKSSKSSTSSKTSKSKSSSAKK